MSERTQLRVADHGDLVVIDTAGAGSLRVTVDENGVVTVNTENMDLSKLEVLDEYGDRWKLDPRIVHLYEWHGGGNRNKACPACKELFG